MDANKGRLISQDMLAKWYTGKTLNCSLFKKDVDSHKHLYFDCEYSNELWGKLQRLTNMKTKLKGLEDSIEQLSKLPCSMSLWSIIRRLSLAYTVYYIWHERNQRLLQSRERNFKTSIQCNIGKFEEQIYDIKS